MRSMMFKLGFIAVMILVFLLPIEMIKSIAHEREARKLNVMRKMSSVWGKENRIGPISFFREVAGRSVRIPSETVTVSGKMQADIRKKGIFELPLYESVVEIKGTLPKLLQSTENLTAYLELNFTYKPGVEILSFQWGREDTKIRRGKKGRSNLLYIRIPRKPSSKYSLKLRIKGMNELHFAPIARKTEISLQSNWQSPNFNGSILPTSRKIGADGFQANWQLNTSVPVDKLFRKDEQWTFGVGLFVPVDVYQQTMRSIKYAILFIFLTFLTFFLIEIMNPLRIHPLQYTLVGFALCLFYLLLLSLSEHLSFLLSYIVATIAIVGLITMYSSNVLKHKGRTVLTGSLLTTLYGFLYILLQMEEYSLLLGSLALFFILAAVMYFTRNIDWYEIFGEPSLVEKPSRGNTPKDENES
ncbi:MAG: cell envelope integrity protein CreD [Spirochaetota bacterium]